MMCYGIPYKPETVPVKIVSYALFTGIMGATLAPIAFMGGTKKREERKMEPCITQFILHVLVF